MEKCCQEMLIMDQGPLIKFWWCTGSQKDFDFPNIKTKGLWSYRSEFKQMTHRSANLSHDPFSWLRQVFNPPIRFYLGTADLTMLISLLLPWLFCCSILFCCSVHQNSIPPPFQDLLCSLCGGLICIASNVWTTYYQWIQDIAWCPTCFCVSSLMLC